MRHWFNWLLGEPLPKYTPPTPYEWYRVESSFSGFSYKTEYTTRSLVQAEKDMDILIEVDPHKYYRIVRS